MWFFSLIMDFSKIYQPLIFFLYFSDLFGICGAMLLLQVGIVQYQLILVIKWRFFLFCVFYSTLQKEGNLVLLLMSLSLLWWALILTYLPCEFGERLSNGMVEINDCIDQFNWYLFSLEIRKILPMILLSVQQPVEIRFFGSIACNRDSFKKVSFKG